MISETKYKCSVCENEYEYNDMPSIFRPQARRTGLCPACYTARVKKRKELAKQRAAEREAASERRMKVREQSAFTKVYNMLKAAHLSDENLEKLQDRNFTQKATAISYQLLVPKTDDRMADRAKTFYASKNRYARDTVEINGRQFYVTNNVYLKNINRVRNMLIEMNAINPDEFQPVEMPQ